VKITRRTAGATTLALAGVAAIGAPVGAAPDEQLPAAGAVVGLAGTPHLWIADAQGLLHWAGDTRALAGKTILWSTRRDVTLDQLKTMQRGDPWLSAGLLKIGTPIYLVKWETEQAQPTLLQIQNIADVEIFGINSANYGLFVMEEAAWQQQYKFTASTLTKGTLAGATGATPAAGATATPAGMVTLVAKKIDQSKTSDTTSVHTVDISGATPGSRLQVSGTYDEYEFDSSGTRQSTTKRTFGPEFAGTATAQGTLRWSRTHPLYSGARYTFTDPAGSKVTIEFTGDV